MEGTLRLGVPTGSTATCRKASIPRAWNVGTCSLRFPLSPQCGHCSRSNLRTGISAKSEVGVPKVQPDPEQESRTVC